MVKTIIFSGAFPLLLSVTHIAQADEACLDVTNETDKECFDNVNWAMLTGVNTNKTWYDDYPVLSESSTFQAFQWVLHHKTGPGEGPGWNCPMPCNFYPPDCYDVTNSSPGMCYDNLLWARQTGLATNPQWYARFPKLTVNSSNADFQYVLHTKLDEPGTTGWQCPLPCTSSLSSAAAVSSTAAPTTTSPVASTTISESLSKDISSTTPLTASATPGSSFPWWAWLMSIGLCLICAAGIAFAYLSMNKETGKRAPKKKKRAAKATVPVAAPEPAAAPLIATPAITTAPPVYAPAMRMAPPIYAQPEARSLQMTAAPQMVAQPMQMVAQPISTVATAVPAYSTAAPGVMSREAALSLFDQLDVNHDGTISRSELARLQMR